MQARQILYHRTSSLLFLLLFIRRKEFMNLSQPDLVLTLQPTQALNLRSSSSWACRVGVSGLPKYAPPEGKHSYPLSLFLCARTNAYTFKQLEEVTLQWLRCILANQSNDPSPTPLWCGTLSVFHTTPVAIKVAHPLSAAHSSLLQTLKECPPCVLHRLHLVPERQTRKDLYT